MMEMPQDSSLSVAVGRYAVWWRRGAILIFVFLLALSIRSLTGGFIREHFDDSGWFQYGSYAMFDRQAQAIMDHTQPAFWIDDPTRTDQILYPPGFPLWMALIYRVSGERTPAAVQAVQIVLDALSVLLIAGIGFVAFGWRSAVLAGI